MSWLVAGIDVATKDVRVTVLDGSGGVRARASVALPAPQHPRADRSEQDARRWWPAAAHALRLTMDELGDDARRVAAVASSAGSGTFVLVDGHGEPLGPALLYNDRRAEDQAKRANRVGASRWDALGLRPSPSFALAKLAWLADRGRLSAAAGAWGAADLIVARLTGENPTTDWSHALKSGYDLVRREWPDDVLEALDVPARLLPAVAAPGSLAGVVSAQAARDTGLPTGCEVRLGMTDGCTAQLACGAVTEGSFVSVLGTTLVVKGASARLVRDPAGVVYSHLHPDGLWLPGGASNTGGEVLNVRFAGAQLPALDAAAGARGPSDCVCYPLERSGERFPFLEPAATGFMLGKARDEIDAYRSALEGVALLERLAYAHLASLGADAGGPIATAGSASTSQIWNRIRATVLGRPLLVPEHPESSFGAGLLAGAHLHGGLAPAAAAMVRYRSEVEPDPCEGPALEASYWRFVEALRARGWMSDDTARTRFQPGCLPTSSRPG